MALDRRQLVLLALLTLVWGLNWPVMKLGVSQFPPLAFRALSIGLGVPLLAVVLAAQRVPFAVERRHWPELLRLTLPNVLLWQVLSILAVRELSSGRAAILAYTMPVFSAVIGAWRYGERLSGRGAAGLAAAALGVLLLLWHELTTLAGRPQGAALMLAAAALWAWGTHRLRRTTLPVPTLALSFWMVAITAPVMAVLALVFEGPRFAAPSGAAWFAILFNAVLVFAFAQPAWFFLARTLPPLASTLSVMLIPVLGVVSGAVWLGETLHWQDYAAMLLLLAAIGSVLLPSSRRF